MTMFSSDKYEIKILTKITKFFGALRAVSGRMCSTLILLTSNVLGISIMISPYDPLKPEIYCKNMIFCQTYYLSKLSTYIE